MPAADTTRAISLAGTLVQLGVTVLVAALAASFWRGSRRRRYLALWTTAWAVLVVALAAVAVRHGLVPPGGSDAAEAGPLETALHAWYQIGKLGFLALLLLGCLDFAGYRVPRPAVSTALAVALGLGLAFGVHPDLDRVVAWQTVLAVPAFAVCARVAGSAWHRRRGVGVAVLVAALAGLAVLWALYVPAFWGLDVGRATGPLRQLAAYNSYVDSVFTFLLALGMVVSYVEDTYAEADAARSRQLETIARSERRHAAVLGAAHDGIVTLDADRAITAMNAAARRVFGVRDATGTPFDGFVAAEHRGALWEELATVTRRSEAHPPMADRREITGLRRDGTEFPLEIAISSIGDESRGYVVVARDLTERVRQRAERERLQHQVSQAARLEAVGRMVSGVAHELNNPLTAIMAFSQDLLATARSDEDRDALTVIVEQAQRCRVIVGDLLLLARARRDERRRVRPEELVDRVLRVFARDAAHRGVALEADVGPDLPAIDLDPVGIEQVLTNLLTNAFQATPPGGQVRLECHPRGELLELVVLDGGPGIPPEVLSRVFEPFFTTKEPGTGTGLGLAVSHAIVRQHGGTLTVENRPGGAGARCTVRLPFVDRRAGARATDPGIPSEAPAPGDGRRVLLIDDEEAIRVAMRRALERRGWVVDEAADGREALLKLARDGPDAAYDVVVTDLRMPGLSGIELCDELARRRPDLAERIVVITGDTASPSVAEFLASGGRPFLQKPFDMRSLADLLARVVAAPGGAA